MSWPSRPEHESTSPTATRSTTMSFHCRRLRRSTLDGMKRGGRSKSVRFDQPGIVRVFCDIHSHMSAFVLVFGHRFFTVTEEDGQYRLDGLLPGTGAPSGFLGHLITREFSQEECRDEEADGGVGGGGGSPEGDRSGRRARPWGSVFGRVQARDGAASGCAGRISSRCRGEWGSRRRRARRG